MIVSEQFREEEEDNRSDHNALRLFCFCRPNRFLADPSCRLTKYLACFRAGCVSLDFGLDV